MAPLMAPGSVGMIRSTRWPRPHQFAGRGRWDLAACSAARKFIDLCVPSEGQRTFQAPGRAGVLLDAPDGRRMSPGIFLRGLGDSRKGKRSREAATLRAWSLHVKPQ